MKRSDIQPSELYHWKIETQAGPLHISFDKPVKRQKIFSMFCRFDDVKKGYELTGNSNKFSGKWNHHLTITAVRPALIAETFICHLESISS